MGERPAGAMIWRAYVLGAAVLFSTGGAVIKATSLPPLQVAGLRSLVAAVVLAVVLPDARRHWSRRNAAIAAVYGATLVLFVTATKLTTAANSVFLQSAAPLYILLLAPWLLHEAVHRRDLVFIGVMASGLALLAVDEMHSAATVIAPRPGAGNLAAAASGVTYAFTLIGLRLVSRSEPAATMNAVMLGNVCAAAVCLPLAPLRSIGAADALALAWLGAAQIGLAYLLLTTGVRHVTALDASLLLLAEPVLNPVWTWLVHGEHPGAWALAGGAVILTATAARTVTEARGPMPAPALRRS